jgi:hypothetical protein
VGQVAFNPTNVLGIVAEFGGYKMSKLTGTSGGTNFSFDVSGSVVTYLFGPRFSRRSDRVTVFGQALFGGAHLGDITSSDPNICGTTTPCVVNAGDPRNAFSMSLGGGVDVRAANHVSIRLGQVEYLLTRFDIDGRSTQNNFRYSVGVVIH